MHSQLYHEEESTLLQANRFSPVRQIQVKDLTTNSQKEQQKKQVTLEVRNKQQITPQLLMEITETQDLKEIRVISLRNKNLLYCLEAMLDCRNLSIAYLQGNNLQVKDLNYLSEFKKLQKLDLSNSNISELPQKFVFQSMVDLQIMYLHDNQISNWEDIENLTGLGQIKHLTLYGNPCSQLSGYRHYLANSLNSLLALDLYIITDEERYSKFISYNNRSQREHRFQSMSDFMKLRMPIYYQSSTAEEHLMRLDIDIYQLKRIYERNSPIITIQRIYRGCKQRQEMNSFNKYRSNAAVTIQKVFRGWNLRLKAKRELKEFAINSGLSHLLLSEQELRELRAASLLQTYGRRFLNNVNRRKLEKEQLLVLPSLGWDNEKLNISTCNEFLSFSDHEEMIQFISQILNCQRLVKKCLFLYFEKTLHQIASATRIQSWFKSLKEKSQLISLQKLDLSRVNILSVYPLLNLNDKILLKRSTACIQKWWKNRKLRLRIQGLEEINKYLHLIEDKTLYLEENLYLNLQFIIAQVKNHLTFPEQNLHFDIKDKSIKAVVDPQFDKIRRYKEYTLPFWLLLNLYIIEQQEIITLNFDNLMSLIHVTEDMDSDIVNYHDICPDTFVPQFKLKFVRMNFKSVEEARRRAVILGLMTYSLMSGPNVFVKMFTRDHLLESAVAVENITRIWKHYQLDQSNSDVYVQSLSKQPHQGLILSDEDILKLKGGNYSEINMSSHRGIHRSQSSQNSLYKHIRSGSYGMIKMRLRNGTGRQIMMHESEQKDIYKDKMKKLGASIAKIQRDISSAQIGSRNENIFGITTRIKQESTGNNQLSARVIIKRKLNKSINGDQIHTRDYSQTSRRPSLNFENTMNLNTERTQKQLNTQIIRKDYFKQVQVLRDMQRVKSLIEAKKNADILRNQNLELKRLKAESTLSLLEDKRRDIETFRENKIVQKDLIQDEEQTQKNYLQRMVSEEKFLRQRLIEKQKDQEQKTKIISRIEVIKQKHTQQLKKDETLRFIHAFSQGRNVIDKKIKEGIKLRLKKQEIDMNKDKVKEIKEKYHRSQNGSVSHRETKVIRCEIFQPVFQNNEQ
eukprot:403345778